jgi:hypothetical protein
MPTIVCNAAALAVAGLFYCWRNHHEVRASKLRKLHERVAYLLWMSATAMS